MAQKNSPDRDDDPIERAREFLTRDDDERWRAGVSLSVCTVQTCQCPPPYSRALVYFFFIIHTAQYS